MRCDREDCTGVHKTSRPWSELCEGAKIKSRARPSKANYDWRRRGTLKRMLSLNATRALKARAQLPVTITFNTIPQGQED